MSLRILHLEDDPQDSELVQSLLQAAGIDCHLVRVATEPEFVAAFERKSFDLILSDFTLPGFQGHAALSIAVKKCPAVPFIFVSGTIGEDVAIESLKSGATDYVLKQKMSRLVPAVRRALAETEQRNKRRRAEQALLNRYEELERLNEIGQMFLGSLEIQPILESILNSILQLKQLDIGNIRLLDPQGLVVAHAFHGYRNPESIALQRMLVGRPPRGTIVNEVVKSKTPLLIPHVQASEGLQTFKREQVQSAVALPIQTQEEVLGVLEVGSRSPRSFQPDEIRLLQAIGNQLGLAVQRARLYEETKRHLDRIRALHEIDLAITSSLDLHAVLHVLLENIDRFLPYSAVSAVRLWNHDTGTLEPVACHNLALQEWKSEMRGPAEDFAKDIVESKAPLMILDLRTDPRTQHIGLFRRYGLISYLGTPLIVKDEFLGVLGYYTKERHEFSLEEIEFLSTLAGQAAVAIHNAQLYEHTKTQTAALETANRVLKTREEIQRLLKELGQDITTLNLDSMLRQLTNKVRDFLNVDICDCRLREGAAIRVIAAAGIDLAKVKPRRRFRLERWKVYEEVRGLIWTSDLCQAKEGVPQESTARELGIRGYIGAPLFSRDGEILGVLRVMTYVPRDFSKEELDLVQQLAGGVGVAVENARLYQQIRKRESDISNAYQQLAALHQVATIASQSLDLDLVLQDVMKHITEIFHIDAVRIFVREAASDTFHLRAHYAFSPEYFPSPSSFRKGEGIIGKVAELGTPMIFQDVPGNSECVQVSSTRTVRKNSSRFFGAFPIVGKGETLGVLAFFQQQPRRLTDQEVQLIHSMSSQLAVAIENARLYEKTLHRRLELETRTAELEQANNVKTEFLSVMSHELRTPLNVIMGYTAIMQDKMLGNTTDAQQDALVKIGRQTQDLLTMITSIMEATKIESGATVVEKYPVDLANLFDELKRTYNLPLDKDVAIIWEYASDLPPILTDGGKLKMILQNFINNAIKFTDKGSITISARVAKSDSSMVTRDSKDHVSRITNPASQSTSNEMRDTSYVEFKISDTGIGIAEPDLAIIFDMFRQVDSSDTRPYGGVGLGLYIVKKFTELLGGTVEVESQVGIGSIFTVKLQCETESSTSVASAVPWHERVMS